ncbi:hypothetical protein VTI74DRAFT_9720 [Chaetomium olivicolor]
MASAAEDLHSAPLIISTSLAKPDLKTRKFIRSHVMRGKNTGKFRSSKEFLVSPIPVAVEDQGPPRKPKSVLQNPGARAGREIVWVVLTPRKVASELSLLGFDTETHPYSLDLIYQALTVVKPSTYALHDITTKIPQDNLFCIANFSHHPGILHSTLFAVQAFRDLRSGGSYGTVARFHLSKALTHLQRSFDDREEAIKLSTMAVVTALAMAAVIAGDLTTAARHMDGLQRILQLRGGIESLGANSMIEHKARAIDLGLAMALGSDLRFSQDSDISWSPQIAIDRSASRFPELKLVLRLHQRPDPRLLNVWADLREFSRLVNDATTRGMKVPGELVSQLALVPHRLIHLGPEGRDPGGNGSLHELLRLCMLAFVKVLLIKIRGVGRQMTFLAQGLRMVFSAWFHCLDLQHDRTHDELPVELVSSQKLLLWGLFVVSVSSLRAVMRDGCERCW